MTVIDNTIQVEDLSDFFKNPGTEGLNVLKHMAKNAFKNPARVLKIGANIGTAVACRSPKAALSIVLEIINFYHKVIGLYQGKFE